MPLNPVTFAAQVNQDFIRYQLTAFPIADERLHEQVRSQLEGHGMAGCPLMKGPYVSLAKAFRFGHSLQRLSEAGVVPPALPALSPYPDLFAHQDKVLAAAQAGHHVLVTTGTGSGKTEALLYPILDWCLRLRDGPPRILLTNPYQLEFLITRPRDLPMFAGAPLRFIVVDEAHRYSGALGAEVSCLIRRLRAVADKGPDEVVCMGTSATIAGEGSEELARRFVHRFYGVDPERIEVAAEEYIEHEWPAQEYLPPDEPPDTVELLERIVHAVSDEDGCEVLAAAEELAGQEAPPDADWREALYSLLARNRYTREVCQVLAGPRDLSEAALQMQTRVGRRALDAGQQELRQRCEAELLCYLTLGAAARQEDNILLRPKIHYFVSGLEGVVAVFPPGEEQPSLYLAERYALEEHPESQPEAIFPVLVCKTCGQHYFEAYLVGWAIGEGEPQGGIAEQDNVVWEAVPRETGGRAVFTDRFLPEEAELEELGQAGSGTRRVDRHRREMWVCRFCGALHGLAGEDCRAPKCQRRRALVRVWVLTNAEDGQITACPACGQRGGRHGDRWCEPMRPVRAVAVADVHVLAQNMLNTAPDERQQKLLVFADNRREAAFQAGWILDHARRYRLRHLFHQHLHAAAGPVSIGDLAEAVSRQLEQDSDLAAALVPEVVEAVRPERFSQEYPKELRYFLRLLVLREIATSFRQREGLEPWGLMRVDYYGVSPDQPRVRRWAEQLGLTPDQVADGIGNLLDVWRRNRHLYDETRLFSKSWLEGDREIQAGYIPYLDVPPKGLRFDQPSGQRSPYVVPLTSARGRTGAEQIVAGWGLSGEQAAGFLEELWDWLINEAVVLARVDLTSSAGKVLARAQGVYQVAADHLGLVSHETRFVCSTCHRVHARPTPRLVCTGWQCGGTLREEPPPSQDYNVRLLRQPFAMLRAQEHSGQVPGHLREQYDREFKKEPPGAVNCLVATPTLELGVDIGDLDMVLMRNVPPTPANYWQRVGRSGRRHRMAVNYTYCRRSSHDRYFFADPLQLLTGHVHPPRFNLDNDVLVAKHIRAAVLTELLGILGETGSNEQGDMDELWRKALPTFIGAYLFDFSGDRTTYRTAPFDAQTPLTHLISLHKERLFSAVRQAFAQYWPEEAAAQVSEEALGAELDGMPAGLQAVVARLHRRMTWAVNTQNRLLAAQQTGPLDRTEEMVLRRCRAFLSGLLEEDERNYTLRMLSVEGFLPGYGMYEQGVWAFAHRMRAVGRVPAQFELTRADTLAVREFVPGNLIYANSGRFGLTFYRLPVRDNDEDLPTLVVSLGQRTVYEAGDMHGQPAYRPEGAVEVRAVPVSDCDLVYRSRISDDEEYRFQLPVTVLGSLLGQHRGGRAYSWAGSTIEHRKGQRLRLVNCGPAERARLGELGYPICSVCGAARSPMSSDEELCRFREDHLRRCGLEPENILLFADVGADGLRLAPLSDPAEAVNLAEGLRIGAEGVLEMEREDLHILLIPGDEANQTAVFLYDPMPGGSGLLDELLAQWPRVLSSARESLSQCPQACEASCYACMRTYQNVQHHALLDRHRAMELLGSSDEPLQDAGEILPVVPSLGEGLPTNEPEAAFLDALRERGFPLPDAQVRIQLGGDLGDIVPDFAYQDLPSGRPVAIFIDGLSRALHSDPKRQAMDAFFRARLQAMDWRILEVPASALSDHQQLALYLEALRTMLS